MSKIIKEGRLGSSFVKLMEPKSIILIGRPILEGVINVTE